MTSRLRDSWTITPLSFADCWICTRRAKMKNGFSGLTSCNKNRTIFSGTRRKVDISLRRLATPAFSFGWKKVILLQVSFSLSLSLSFDWSPILSRIWRLDLLNNNHVWWISEQDGAEPSANSIAVGNLERLAIAVDRSDYHDKAEQTLCLFQDRLAKIPLSLPEMASALLLYEESPTEVMAFFILLPFCLPPFLLGKTIPIQQSVNIKYKQKQKG